MSLQAYTDADDAVVDTYARIHGNGEQTRIVIISAGQNAYAAVAYDVDPGEFEPMAAEAIAYDPTLEGVNAKVGRWMQRNPKGVLGGDAGESESGGRAWSMVKGAAKRLNDYGNKVAQEQQQQHGGPKQ